MASFEQCTQPKSKETPKTKQTPVVRARLRQVVFAQQRVQLLLRLWKPLWICSIDEEHNRVHLQT